MEQSALEQEVSKRPPTNKTLFDVKNHSSGGGRVEQWRVLSDSQTSEEIDGWFGLFEKSQVISNEELPSPTASTGKTLGGKTTEWIEIKLAKNITCNS